MTPPIPPTAATPSPSITCPLCGRTSWHPHDIEQRYCGACHAFTGIDPLLPIVGGFRVAETDTHYLDVLAQAFNWRVAEVPKADPMFVGRYWCYEGRDALGLLAAIAAVLAWVGSGDDEPAGWRKNGQTGAYGPRRPYSDTVEAWAAEQIGRAR